MFEVGKSYKTVGGHKATVVYYTEKSFLVVHHKPNILSRWHLIGKDLESQGSECLLKEEWQEPIIKTDYANIYYTIENKIYQGQVYDNLFDLQKYEKIHEVILAGKVKLVYNSSKPKGKQIEITIL